MSQPQINPPFNLPLRPPYCDRAQHGMALMQQAYLDATRELLAGPLRADSVETRLQAWEQQVYPAVLEAAATHPDAVGFEAWQQARARLRAAIDRLRTKAEARVARGPIAAEVLLPAADPDQDASVQ